MDLLPIITIDGYIPVLGIDTRKDQLFTCRICKKERFTVRKPRSIVLSILIPGPVKQDGDIFNENNPDVCFFCVFQESDWIEDYDNYDEYSNICNFDGSTMISYPCGNCLSYGSFDKQKQFHSCGWKDYDDNGLSSYGMKYREKMILDTKQKFLAIMNKEQIKLRYLVILVWKKSDQMKRLPKDVLKYLCILEFPLLCKN
jgi:hypothetical protein